MLENLRGKLYNVQQDLTASLRNLTVRDGSAIKNANLRVKTNAGADVLNHFQKEWEKLHSQSEENVEKAKEIDGIIGNLHEHCEQQFNTIQQLNVQLNSLPQLLSSIQQLMKRIGELDGHFIDVDEALIKLEDVIETQEMQEKQLDQRFQLALYKEKRRANFEEMKVFLMEKHKASVLELERSQQAISRDREQVFQEAFQEDVERYKAEGYVKKSLSGSDNVSIENVVLNASDEERSTFNAFLGDAESEGENNADAESEADDTK